MCLKTLKSFLRLYFFSKIVFLKVIRGKVKKLMNLFKQVNTKSLSLFF